MGEITPDNIIGLNLQSEHHLDRVAACIEKGLRQKKKTENDLDMAADRIAERR